MYKFRQICYNSYMKKICRTNEFSLQRRVISPGNNQPKWETVIDWTTNFGFVLRQQFTLIFENHVKQDDIIIKSREIEYELLKEKN